MDKNCESNILDIDLSKLTQKIIEISIEIETFRRWKEEEWEPYVQRISVEYNVKNLSNSMRESIEEYFKESFSFIANKLLKYNYIILSINLRQFLIDIYKYNFYLERMKNKTNKKFVGENIDQYDEDEKFNNKKEKLNQQQKEDLILKESKFIGVWAKILFKNFENNYKNIKNEIEKLKNSLSMSLHSNSSLFFNSKLTISKNIDKIIEEKINLINENLMAYDGSSKSYKILSTINNPEYEKFRARTSKKFHSLLSSWMEGIKKDFFDEYNKLVELSNLKE